jgi:hypothetical protein
LYQELRQRSGKGNPFKFTKGTDPAVKSLISYLVDESIACPSWLPIDENDGLPSANALMAATINETIPISEYARKEHYYNCFTNFKKAIEAEPALLKIEIIKKLKKFD